MEGDQFDLRSADVFCLASILSLWLVVVGERQEIGRRMRAASVRCLSGRKHIARQQAAVVLAGTRGPTSFGLLVALPVRCLSCAGRRSRGAGAV